MSFPFFDLNNGVRMPAIGFGVFLIDVESVPQVVSDALECGYRLIDTAACYNNEKAVGEGIRRSGISRANIFVTTKLWVGDQGRDRTLHAFEHSLKNLGLDYVDMYMIHWPLSMKYTETLESWKIMAELQREGRIRALGVCNHSEEDLNFLIRETGMTPAVNQVELHPYFQQKALREVHRRLGILTQAWSPLGGVRGYNANAQQSMKSIHTDPVLRELAAKYGKTPAQVVLRWDIQNGVAANSKSTHKEHILSNFQLFDFTLSPEDMATIQNLDTGVRGGDDPRLVNAETYPVTIE